MEVFDYKPPNFSHWLDTHLATKDSLTISGLHSARGQDLAWFGGEGGGRGNQELPFGIMDE